MKRWLRRLLYACVGICLLYVLAGVVIGWLVGGSSRDRMVASLGAAIGVPVTVESASFSLTQWLQFHPALTLESVTIGNPPGFQGPHLLEAKRMFAQVPLIPLLSRRVEVRSIEIDSPRILIEQNAKGETNLEVLIKQLSAGPSSAEPPTVTLSVDDFRVTSGEVLLSGGAAPGIPLALTGIDARVRDFSADRKCRMEFSGRLFGGKESSIKIEGLAGPFRPDSLALDGTAAVRLAVQEIPAKVRDAQFGDFLRAPGAKSRVTLDATIKGDIYTAVSGPAKLEFSGLSVGKDDKHALPLSGSAPATLTASRLMSAPEFHVRIPQAKLRLGAGEWNGSLDAALRGSMIKGSSRGSIRNVDINDLLSAVTSSGSKIYGLFEMSSYSVEFAGKSAAELRNSLRGGGKLKISKGRLAALDMLASIEQALAKRLDSGAAQGSTPFSNLTADLSVQNSQLQLSNILFESTALGFTGNGVIGFDQALHFDLDSRVGGGLATLVNRLTRRPEGSEAKLPLVIAGRVDAPQIRPNTGKLATGIAQGLLDSLLKGK